MLFLQTIIRMKDNWKYSKYWSVVCWKLCPSSHCLGLLGNRTIRHRNIDMDQCKLKYCAVVCWVLCPSHRHLLNIFHFFYLKCTSVRNNYRWINLFYYITPFIQNNLSIGSFPILQATLNHDFHLYRFI